MSDAYSTKAADSDYFREKFGGRCEVKTFDRIMQSPDVLAGRATIRGLRISVAHVVNLVANGMTPAQIVEELPDLEEEDIRQALVYAAALAQDEVHPLRA
jgi:uncharacterized protein (DUF433 family)